MLFFASAKLIETQWNYNIRTDCCFGRMFRKCILPDRLVKKIPEMLKIQKRLNLIDCTMVSHIFTWTTRCNKTPQMHLNKSLTFLKGPVADKLGLGILGRKIGFRGTARNLAVWHSMPKQGHANTTWGPWPKAVAHQVHGRAAGL